MFKKTVQRNLPNKPTVYPLGTVVSTERGYFYLKSNSFRLRISSKQVLDSWKFHRIVETSEKAVSNYRIMNKLGFRQGSLIYNIADGKMYLIEDNKRRWITSPDALERINASKDEALTVSNEDIKLHTLGEPLN